ncbi:AfsR/SARP family transcriptional regulator [Paenibacillus humicola]|uniref:AfsR/SARP family transcriptional regulator n=1 Tax=Paenibacillus humicola TaxID=3110540 RepID=UPI00237A646F|nr:BTAD domain-containing putative transcriptional regulator [Paenibacillus humicola]
MDRNKASGNELGDAWSDKVLAFERAILDGGMLQLEELRSIPDAYRLKSPVLLRAECEDGLLSGNVHVTKKRLETALKGYAAQADEQAMLTMMGMLALLYGQVGDRIEAKPVLLLLEQEWARSPERCSGFVPWALARLLEGVSPSTGAERGAPGASELFYEAADGFRREGKPVWAAFALLDRLLFDPVTIDGTEWELWVRWIKRHASEARYGKALGELLANRSGNEELYASLPGRYAYLCRAVLSGAADEQPDEPLAEDIEILQYASAAKIRRALRSGEVHGAAAELNTLTLLLRSGAAPAMRRLAASLAEEIHAARENEHAAAWLPPGAAEFDPSSDKALVDEVIGDPSLNPAYDGAPPANGPGRADGGIAKWRVKLFDGISFGRIGSEEARPVWKRRKAGELLVYLLVQPGYRASREQVIERVFGEGDPAKRSNQLYVTLHDLRQTLRDMGLSDDPVYARRGVIGIEEQWVDVVDYEKYLALSRVGDQLWTDDREEACRLYDEALPIYGKLGTELPQTDWLERLREQLLDRQTIMLKRLAVYYTEIRDDIRAEQRLADWISFRPEQEEAYELMIRHNLGQGRRTEAAGWYRRLERVCKEELGSRPNEEIQRLLWG